MTPDPLASRPVAPPLHLASVYALPDLASLDAAMADAGAYTYARDRHPNGDELAERVRALHHAAWSLVCGSGMAALTAGVLAFVEGGGRVLASDRLYGRTSMLLTKELARFGVQTSFVDCTKLEAVLRAFVQPANLLVLETIANPWLRVVDLPSLCKIAHQHECRVLIDNTFASPYLCRPLTLGADLVMESFTKILGGHSDLTLGTLSGNDPRLEGPTRERVGTWGLSAAPFDCWLGLRGLETAALRVARCAATAARLADLVAEHPAVARVSYPGRADHPDRELAERLLPGGCGWMIALEFAAADGRAAVERFVQASGVALAPSLGGTRALLSHPASASHRYLSEEEKARQEISAGLLRVSVGLEEPEELEERFARGLAAATRG